MPNHRSQSATARNNVVITWYRITHDVVISYAIVAAPRTHQLYKNDMLKISQHKHRLLEEANILF